MKRSVFWSRRCLATMRTSQNNWRIWTARNRIRLEKPRGNGKHNSCASDHAKAMGKRIIVWRPHMGLECMVVACLNCRAQAKHTSSQNFQNAFLFNIPYLSKDFYLNFLYLSTFRNLTLYITNVCRVSAFCSVIGLCE